MGSARISRAVFGVPPNTIVPPIFPHRTADRIHDCANSPLPRFLAFLIRVPWCLFVVHTTSRTWPRKRALGLGMSLSLGMIFQTRMLHGFRANSFWTNEKDKIKSNSWKKSHHTVR